MSNHATYRRLHGRSRHAVQRAVAFAALLGALSAAAAEGRWPPEKARQWYESQPWLVGCNFVPSTAVNDVEMWQAATFDPATIERELGWAHALGFNTVRVFINFVVWKADPEGLVRRLDQFLAIADRHKIGTMAVLLDDCFKQNPTVGPQEAPVPGVHNSQWVASPGEGMVRDSSAWGDLERYVKAVVKAFAHDRRLLVWDLYNEPSQSLALVEAAFRWAREVGPDQPLTTCVYGGSCDHEKLAELSDVISFHCYGPIGDLRATIDRLAAYERPLLCTEWMCRPVSRFETHLPVLAERRVGAWNWGLVAGKTQTYYPWGSPQGAPEPAVWFHDILRPNGTPFNAKEALFVRVLTGVAPPSALPVVKVLVPTAERGPVAWRYTLQQPADAWRLPGFDDASWQEGRAPFGREEQPIARAPNTVWKSADIWLRRVVEMPEAAYADPALRIHHDEDVEVYIDGVPALQAQGYTAAYETIDITPAAAEALRKPGNHVLAVHCRQTVGGQYIDLGIVGADAGATPGKAGDDFAWLRGANLVPSYARNDVQTWADYDPAAVDRDLALAEKLGLNCVRVFLQAAVYERDPARFLGSFESFLALCATHRIRMMPVVFDSCFGEFPDLEKYREKDWMACPGQHRLGPEHWPAMEKYVRDVVGRHKDDARIVMWDVMNEPYVTSFNGPADRQKIHTFLGHALETVRRAQPSQPLTVGWESWQLAVDPAQYAEKVDVVAFHNYTPELREAVRSARAGARKLGKPVIINEVVGRPHQSFQLVMPILREEKIGWCFWELMLARSQFSRNDPPYQGLVYPDGQCYDAEEVAQVMDRPRAEAAKLFPQRRWTRTQAWDWYRAQPWIVGFNFVPSTAGNTTELWSAETFDAPTIDRELGWGARLGFNSCRVFVQYLVWKHDPEGLKQRIDKFLAIAASHGLTTILVPFDDCAFGDPPQTEPFLGKQRDPIPGMIGPSWTPSPGLKAVTDRSAWPDLEKYVKDLVGAFGRDRRVLMWDLYNEPGNTGMGEKSLPLLEAAFAWARAADPSQPLTVGVWGGPAETARRQLALSDVVSFHFYGNHDGLRSRIAELKTHLRPVINTEWMARLQGSVWATDLPLFKREAVGCCCWGLVNGRAQFQFAWGDKRGTPEPKIWFHDLLRRDGTPYDPAELEVIRATAADKKIDWSVAEYSTPRPGQPAHEEDGMRFSDGWTRWTGAGPRKDRLHYANTAGAAVTWECRGGTVTLIHKVGPDCGRARVLIDDKPAAPEELDMYSPDVGWNRRTVVAKDLPAGRHVVTVISTGTRNEKSSNAYVQVVDFE